MNNNRKYDDGSLYNVSFSMINQREYELLINALKRQVDYYRNKVFNISNINNEFAAANIKYNYKVYNDLYNKIINDYHSVVNCNG